MTLFTALIIAGIIYFFPEFMQIATANIWLNGVIIGTSLFGIGLCFVQMFSLLPEYKWLHGYISGHRTLSLPPRLLRPVATILSSRPRRISAITLDSLLDMIQARFDESRESTQYITNTLIFLGLLGTFWGLLLTVGGFAEMISSLDFSSDTVLQTMQAGMTKPLSGMSTAFTSSLLGLAGSLIVGFLSQQVQSTQNIIMRELSNYLSARAKIVPASELAQIIPQINLITHQITQHKTNNT